jgi:hypothetical protein
MLCAISASRWSDSWHRHGQTNERSALAAAVGLVFDEVDFDGRHDRPLDSGPGTPA